MTDPATIDPPPARRAARPLPRAHGRPWAPHSVACDLLMLGLLASFHSA